MYCWNCEQNFFAGSICPLCGGKTARSSVRFSHSGEQVSHSFNSESVGNAVIGGKTGEATGGGEVVAARLFHKFFESIMACVLFSVLLRVVLFLIQVADSLMETGGTVKAGISLYDSIKMPIGWYEYGVWMLIFILIFRYRHTPE